jgi:hypothetical protein
MHKYFYFDILQITASKRSRKEEEDDNEDMSMATGYKGDKRIKLCLKGNVG